MNKGLFFKETATACWQKVVSELVACCLVVSPLKATAYVAQNCYC